MIDNISTLIASGIIGSPTRSLTEEERMKQLAKVKRKASKQTFKEARAQHNRALWKKYFGIDAEKLNEKVMARKKVK